MNMFDLLPLVNTLRKTPPNAVRVGGVSLEGECLNVHLMINRETAADLQQILLKVAKSDPSTPAAVLRVLGTDLNELRKEAD